MQERTPTAPQEAQAMVQTIQNHGCSAQWDFWTGMLRAESPYVEADGSVGLQVSWLPVSWESVRAWLGY